MENMKFGIHVNRDDRHLSITKYIMNSIMRASAYNLTINIVAIFISNPRGLQIILKDEEQLELKQYIEINKCSVIAHSSYVAYLWNKDNSDKYIDFVLKEYNICKQTGINGLVVHLPKESILKKKPIKNTIKKLLNSIKATNLDPNPKDNNFSPLIYLETPAITPMWANYDTPEKLSQLFYVINKIDHNHLFGLCIDTAHIWTSGNDISTYNGAKRWFTALLEAPYIPPPNKILIHLNDSARELGRGPDKHAALTHGHIWGAYKSRNEIKKSGLYFILEFSKKYNIPIIIERGDNDTIIEDYKVLSKLRL